MVYIHFLFVWDKAPTTILGTEEAGKIFGWKHHKSNSFDTHYYAISSEPKTLINNFTYWNKLQMHHPSHAKKMSIALMFDLT